MSDVAVTNDGGVTTFNVNHFECITTKERFNYWMTQLEDARSVCFDTETSGLDAETCDLAGYSFAYHSRGMIHACYIPVGHQPHLGKQLPITFVHPRVRKLLESGKPVVGANLPYDMRVLSQERYKATIKTFHDTQRMSYVLTGNKHFTHGMDALADRILGYKTIKFADVVNADWGVPDFTHVRHDTATKYSGEDTAVTLVIAMILQSELKKAGLWEVYTQIDLPLLPVLVAMKQHGVKVDVKKLAALEKAWAPELERIEKKAHQQAGKEFNLRSTQQVAALLYDPVEQGGLGIDCKHFTDKKGQAVDKEALQAIPGVPLVDTLLEYKQYATLMSSFVLPLPSLVNPRTGRVHTDLNDTLTKTRRFSSSKPNLQNIPTRSEEGKELRAAFVAEPGNVLISADYSQIEYRVLAHVSQDEYLMHAFNNSIDMHAKMAADVRGGNWEDFNNKEDKARYSVRSAFKNVNFATLYGAGPYLIAAMSKISVDEAIELLLQHEEMCPGVYVWKEENLQFARQHEYVETLFGGRTHLKYINSRNMSLRGADERLAGNAPIQGGAAELIRLAMPRVHAACLEHEARLLLQIHDELVAEVARQKAKAAAAHIANAMGRAADHLVKWRVPIIAETGIGKNWRDAK